MIGTTDVTAIVTVIGAVSAAITSIIIAWRQSAVKAIAADTNAKVTTPNGTSIGEIIAANDLTGASDHHTPEGTP
jgi:hypothetical protein